MYNKTTDSNEHVELVDVLLNFKGARGLEKMQVFVLTLKAWAISRFRRLRNEIVDS